MPSSQSAPQHQTMLVPLTSFDTLTGDITLTTSFVLEAEPGDLDVDKFKGAVERVMDKWRVLAGRLVWIQELNTHAVLVPLGALPDGYEPFTCSVTTHPSPSPFVESPSLSSSIGHRLPFPSLPIFLPPSTPKNLTAYVKNRTPLLHWHVADYSDVTIVSLSVVHSLLDGTGVGMVFKAINAELAGEKWEVPPMYEENQYAKRLGEIQEVERAKEEKEDLRPIMPGWVSAPPYSNFVRLLLHLTVEKLWHKTEEGCLFVGSELLAELVAEAKEEAARTGDDAFVSEADIVTNWAYQAMYRYDPSPPTSISVSAAVSLRDLCSTPSIPLHSYPHNLLGCYPLHSPTPLPLSTLLSSPLSSLALLSRHSLIASRTLPFVAALCDWAAKRVGKTVPFMPDCDPAFLKMPWGKRETTVYQVFSNQIVGDLLSLNFPHTSPHKKISLKAFYEPGNPTPDFLILNKLEGKGYFFGGNMRRARWESFERSVREAEEGLRERRKQV